MSTRTHTGRLLLSTRDPLLLPEPSRLITTLTRAGFVGDPLAGRGDAFAIGEQFLQLVTFAGCSVRIELSPQADAPFCHIRLAGPFERPVFLSGRNTRPPRCPNCRSPFRDWREALREWHGASPAPIPCPDCNQANLPWAYDWKEGAGFGRLFVQVEEVFPGEGTPTPSLLELLESSTRRQWRHFYIQDA